MSAKVLQIKFISITLLYQYVVRFTSFQLFNHNKYTKNSHYNASKIKKYKGVGDFLYHMEKEIKRLKVEVAKRLYSLHQSKFGGNNVHLAKASGCTESTIRNIFAKLNDKDKGQDITLGMAFRLCYALEVDLSDLVKELEIKKENLHKRATK